MFVVVPYIIGLLARPSFDDAPEARSKQIL